MDAYIASLPLKSLLTHVQRWERALPWYACQGWRNGENQLRAALELGYAELGRR